jgi:Zinc-binding domain of primase-helicase
MVELDIAKLRAATAEFGYQPATTDDEHLEKLRADNERFDRMNAHDPYHSPCPVCGRHTRFKQYPIRHEC